MSTLIVADTVSTPEVITRDFGGGALTRAALAGEVPNEWYADVPENANEWRAAAHQVAADFAKRDWLNALKDAFAAQGGAAERLARVAQQGGIVVTTGQQPGLFGGPIYTWSKAFSALTLADEIERVTGVPAAPVFWAATDDADFTEASYTVVASNGETYELRMPDSQTGLPMAETPLGDVSEQFRMLAMAAGSAIDPTPLEVARAAYAQAQTVGGAYVTLLRTMLEPLGIAVLDAAHPAVRAASADVIRCALRRATPVRDALSERSKAIVDAGYKVQVQPVPNLSLVFQRDESGRTRVPVKSAAAVAEEARDGDIGPNVLLRPVVERQILPTVAYVAGPAEYAYFAQVSAVADALELVRPRVVPRWSALIVEPHVHEILDAIGATVDDFRDPHAVEGRVAREELPSSVRGALAGMRDAVQNHVATLRANDDSTLALQKAVAGFESQVEYRIARLERRYAAAVKRLGSARLHDVAVARASLFPRGVPQERALNILPFWARYGTVVRDGMIVEARRHARTLVGNGG